MARVPFTSEWEWASLARNYNTSFSGGVWTERTPEVVQRSRWSDEAYSSEKGTTSSSLSGFNGGITETITAGTLANVGRFTKSSGTMDFTTSSSNWIEGAGTGGSSFYTMPELSTPETGMVNTLFNARLVNDFDLVSDGWFWFCCAISPGDLGNLPGTIYFVPTPYASGAYTSTTDFLYSPSGNAFIKSGAKNVNAGSPVTTGNYTSNIKWNSVASDTNVWSSGVFTYALATRTINYECIADTQSYPTQGVDWYKQTQTWKSIPTGY